MVGREKKGRASTHAEVVTRLVRDDLPLHPARCRDGRARDGALGSLVGRLLVKGRDEVNISGRGQMKAL